jgi:hypothetical protein
MTRTFLHLLSATVERQFLNEQELESPQLAELQDGSSTYGARQASVPSLGTNPYSVGAKLLRFCGTVFRIRSSYPYVLFFTSIVTPSTGHMQGVRRRFQRRNSLFTINARGKARCCIAKAVEREQGTAMVYGPGSLSPGNQLTFTKAEQMFAANGRPGLQTVPVPGVANVFALQPRGFFCFKIRKSQLAANSTAQSQWMVECLARGRGCAIQRGPEVARAERDSRISYARR